MSPLGCPRWAVSPLGCPRWACVGPCPRWAKGRPIEEMFAKMESMLAAAKAKKTQ